MKSYPKNKVGIFDSGFGGLTVFKEIKKLLPNYDYIYLGDNSRAPYGSKSFKTVYNYTSQCVDWLIDKGCAIVIIACNTASARALRSYQQNKLQKHPSYVRVLGVIRPTAEIIGNLTQTSCIGILATEGTVKSKTYEIEIQNFFPHINVYQKPCKLWVPIIEDNKTHTPLMQAVVKHDVESLLNQNPKIDTILLGCTHFPLVENLVNEIVEDKIKIISQGEIVALSLKNYLERHQEFNTILSMNKTSVFFTTDDPEIFEEKASMFLGENVKALHAAIE